MRQRQGLSFIDPDDSVERIPLLPFRSVVLFPRNVLTVLVARPRSIHAVEEAMLGDATLAVTAHKDSNVDEPRPADLHEFGTLATVLNFQRVQNGNLQVVLEGTHRVRLSEIAKNRPFFRAAYQPVEELSVAPDEARALIQHVQGLVTRWNDGRQTLATEIIEMIERATNPGHLADLLATQLITEASERQVLLENLNPLDRLEQVGVHLTKELEVIELKQKIKDRVRDKMDQSNREYYLREQLKAIHDELGGEDGNEFEQMRHQIAARQMPADVEEKLTRELGRLEKMPSVSAESTVVRSYLETMIALPWHETTEDRLDLDEAERILNEDHYGLEKVKERIIEFLAVRKLTMAAGTANSAQILCLIGPPGVGKTSLGRSIARAMGRKFVRVSLGGVRDEAEIRGHRRTYIGAMPGRIVGAFKTAETVNPVILLDEIDKLASDYRGDPTAAMLEVLDPEQNQTFTDHYLDTHYDLSKALFITTANYGHQIPRPLQDRMEMIEVSGYTEDEKAEIGARHLLPRQLTANGLAPDALQIAAEVWRQLIRDYTREAGVRGLDRELASLCRKIATLIARGRTDADGTVELTPQRLEEFLGPKRYGYEQDLGKSHIGIAVGLGTTEVGGELIKVEVVTMPGKGQLQVTGQAGEVMQESARAALSYARSRSDELHIDRNFQETLDLHIHFPEGATPKDGPSAGITIATALISALTHRPVRNDTAMTGEITLQGRVLPIGGLRDKALAAHRHGLRCLIVPKDNQRDLREIPENVRNDLDIVMVASMDEVIRTAIMLDIQQADDLQETADRRIPGPPPTFHPDIVDAQSR